MRRSIRQIWYARAMRLPVIFIMLFFSLAAAHAEETLLLDRAQWSVPKTDTVVLAMPVLQKVMKQLQHSAHTRLNVYYPGGDEGSLWATELRGWLVSLGLESRRIQLVSGSQYQDRLQLEIVK